MWEELQTYKPPPVCTCDAAATYEKERELFHQFVMGLDESRFGHVVTAIILADVLPDLGKVYNKVIREEDRLNPAKSREQQQEAVRFFFHDMSYNYKTYLQTAVILVIKWGV